MFENNDATLQTKSSQHSVPEGKSTSTISCNGFNIANIKIIAGLLMLEVICCTDEVLI